MTWPSRDLEEPSSLFEVPSRCAVWPKCVPKTCTTSDSTHSHLKYPKKVWLASACFCTCSILFRGLSIFCKASASSTSVPPGKQPEESDAASLVGLPLKKTKRCQKGDMNRGSDLGPKWPIVFFLALLLANDFFRGHGPNAGRHTCPSGATIHCLGATKQLWGEAGEGMLLWALTY